jgi:serine/threonine-protein kinase RIO1
MLNRGVFSEIHGCVSTGKEANVYHAATADGQHLAIKVYKTSILVFKDRDRYVTGDYRFRTGYCRSNPRKMVKTWAEKEMRNLARLRAAGVPAPAPLMLRLHVLVMEFIGDNGVAAPRLKVRCLLHLLHPSIRPCVLLRLTLRRVHMDRVSCCVWPPTLLGSTACATAEMDVQSVRAARAHTHASSPARCICTTS